MEAKNAVDNFKTLEQSQLLGDSVSISLAFSQQAMQAKKKVKESRKKPTILAPPQIMNLPQHNYTNQGPMMSIGINSATQNLNSINTHLTNLNSMASLITPTQNPLTSPMNALNPSLNSTAMLAMMNIINMNKVIFI